MVDSDVFELFMQYAILNGYVADDMEQETTNLTICYPGENVSVAKLLHAIIDKNKENLINLHVVFR